MNQRFDKTKPRVTFPPCAQAAYIHSTLTHQQNKYNRSHSLEKSEEAHNMLFLGEKKKIKIDVKKTVISTLYYIIYVHIFIYDYCVVYILYTHVSIHTYT